MKGPLGTMTQLFITVGIFVSFIFGLAFPKAPSTDFDPAHETPDWEEYGNSKLV